MKNENLSSMPTETRTLWPEIEACPHAVSVDRSIESSIIDEAFKIQMNRKLKGTVRSVTSSHQPASINQWRVKGLWLHHLRSLCRVGKRVQRLPRCSGARQAVAWILLKEGAMLIACGWKMGTHYTLLVRCNRIAKDALWCRLLLMLLNASDLWWFGICSSPSTQNCMMH